MRPSIADGDLLIVAPADRARFEPGVVAVYRSGNRLFAHRLVAIGCDAAGAPVLMFRGDAAAQCDVPVASHQILGEVIAVERRPILPEVLARARAMAARPARRLNELARHTCLAITRRVPFS
jgi:hypothetical protein